jgi:hypothetical protein
VRPKKTVQGGGASRRRWVDPQGNIWEEDRKSHTLEKYSDKGKHLGEYDPDDGHEIQGPIPGRKTPR